MIDPNIAGLADMPWGGCVDPQTKALEEVRLQLAHHLEGLGEIAASLESMEHLAVVQEAAQVFVPLLRARSYAEAAAQALRNLLGGQP
jgi:hypothetical protein